MLFAVCVAYFGLLICCVWLVVWLVGCFGLGFDVVVLRLMGFGGLTCWLVGCLWVYWLTVLFR